MPQVIDLSAPKINFNHKEMQSENQEKILILCNDTKGDSRFCSITKIRRLSFIVQTCSNMHKRTKLSLHANSITVKKLFTNSLSRTMVMMSS